MFRIRPILQQNVRRVLNNNIIKKRYLPDKSEVQEKKLDFLKLTKFYIIGTGIYGFGSGVYIFSTQFNDQAKEKPFESIFVSVCLGLLSGVGWPGQILLKTVQGMDSVYQKIFINDKDK